MSDKSIMPKDPVKRRIWCLEKQIKKDGMALKDIFASDCTRKRIGQRIDENKKALEEAQNENN